MAHRQPWTAEDVATLRGGIRLMDICDIAATLERSESAVRAKARKIGLLQPPADFTGVELAKRLGVSAATVGYWRRKRWLSQMTHKALRRMLKAHPDILDAEKVDLAWVIGVIAA